MNNPNYLSPLPPQEQKSLALWYACSVYILMGLGALLIIINAYQYIQTRKAREAYLRVHSSLQQLQQQSQGLEPLQKKSILLQKRIDKINNIMHHPFNPALALQELANHLPDDVCLTEFSCSDDNKCAFQGYTAKVESVISFVQTLSDSPSVEALMIASLTPAQAPSNKSQWFQFQIKGTLHRLIQ